MKAFFFSLLFISLSSDVFACEGKDCKLISATIPIYSQKLSIQIDSQMQPAHQGPPGDFFLFELVPKGETVQSWTRMLTVTGVKGLASQLGVQEAAQIESQAIRKACPDSYFEKVTSIKIKQGYNSFSIIMGCKESPLLPKNTSETSVYLFIKGKNDIYFIKKSFRTPIGKLILDESNLEAMAPELYKIKICKNDGRSPSCELENP